MRPTDVLPQKHASDEEVFMGMKRQQDTPKHLQSWGNLALVDERLGAPQSPKVRNLSLVPVTIKENSDQESGIDSLGPARGMILGIGLSSLLWGAIILVLSWIV